METFNYKTFHLNLKKDFESAYEAVSVIESFAWGHHRVSKDNTDTEEDLNKERLRFFVDTIKLKLEFCMEVNGLHKMLDKFLKGFSEFESNIYSLSMIPYIGELYSPLMEFLGFYHDALISHVEIKDANQISYFSDDQRLERILGNTGTILSNHQIEPKNEKDVRLEIVKILSLIFPDTIREVQRPKVSGVYKADIGIPSLKTLIEYKFIDDKNSIKTSIGGVFEDIKGYGGSLDWTKFIAVFYMTDNFITIDQIEAEFKLSNVDKTWKPILVVGKGGRRKPAPIKIKAVRK